MVNKVNDKMVKVREKAELGTEPQFSRDTNGQQSTVMPVLIS
jgi:hypothetical protein